MEGRLCYQVDVNDIMNQVDTKKLSTHGLAFMMDYNEDRLGLDTDSELDTSIAKDIVDMHEKDYTKNEAMIYIETLGNYNYAMKAIL